MALKPKRLPVDVKHHTHDVLDRIATKRGITLRQLGREIIEAFVSKELHDAKVVLGIEDDNYREPESSVIARTQAESHVPGRNGGRR